MIHLLKILCNDLNLPTTNLIHAKCTQWLYDTALNTTSRQHRQITYQTHVSVFYWLSWGIQMNPTKYSPIMSFFMFYSSFFYNYLPVFCRNFSYFYFQTFLLCHNSTPKALNEKQIQKNLNFWVFLNEKMAEKRKCFVCISNKCQTLKQFWCMRMW